MGEESLSSKPLSRLKMPRRECHRTFPLPVQGARPTSLLFPPILTHFSPVLPNRRINLHQSLLLSLFVSFLFFILQKYLFCRPRYLLGFVPLSHLLLTSFPFFIVGNPVILSPHGELSRNYIRFIPTS